MANPRPRTEAMQQVLKRAEDYAQKTGGFFKIVHKRADNTTAQSPEYVVVALDQHGEVIADDRGQIVSDPYRLPGHASHC